MGKGLKLSQLLIKNHVLEKKKPQRGMGLERGKGLKLEQKEPDPRALSLTLGTLVL